MMKKIFLFIVCFVVGFVGSLILNRPAISVVMSTYNRAAFLPRSIESILNQTFADFEFIIVNDGSSDETAKVLNLFAAKDKRIRVITNEHNQGLVYSLNLGLDLARGKYIARMDDDDVSLPTRFEKQYAFMEQNPDFVAVGSWIGRPDNEKKWPFHDETDPEKLKVVLYLNRVPISHPASFIRRSFLNEHGIRYSSAYKAAEDRKFWLDIFDAEGKIGNLPEVLLLFRLHGSNPKEYYRDQWLNSRKFFNEEILPRFGITEEFSGSNQCDVLKKMVTRNKQLNLVSQQILEQQISKECPPDFAEQVQHALWNDYFVFDGKRVCRHKISTECADVIQKTNDTLRLKWDRWGTETFKKEKGVWHIKN